MMRIELEVDTEDYSRDVDSYVRGLLDPAIAEGINETAFLVKDALTAAMGTAFDRPYVQLGQWLRRDPIPP